MDEGAKNKIQSVTYVGGSSSALEILRAGWKKGELPDLWETLEQNVPLAPSDLVALLREAQVVYWHKHQPILVESFFEHCPQLWDHIEDALELIEGEVQLRRSLQQSPALAEYSKRFPKVQSQLATIFKTPADATAKNNARLDETIFPNRPDETKFAPPPVASNTAQTLFAPEGGENIKPYVQAVPQIPGYEVVSELGRGGMGVVYKAHQVLAGRDVALKVIRPDMLGIMPSDTQSNTIGRFRHEARAAGRLQHDHIVTVFEVGEWNAFHYFAMRLVDGPSLVQLVRERPLENMRAAKFLAGTARGVQFAHEQGILHRDLKPHNVLIDNKTQRAMVADFGLAKFTADSEELTRAGDVIGTPSYMSPEQARDSSKVTTLSDVYSLGATLYHVIAGKPPFQAANLGETIRQILHDEPLSPRQLNPAVDRDLETICLKSLQKEPSRRYPSAEALADDLERYIRGEPILARPISNTEKVVRWCKRNPALAGSLGSALALAIIAILAIVIGYQKTAAALAQSQISLQKSEESLQQAMSAVDDLLTKVSDVDLRDQPGFQKVRVELLLKANERLQSILQKNLNNPRIRPDLAKAYFNVGSIYVELDQPTEAKKYLQGAERLQRLLLEEAEGKETKTIRLALSDTLNAFGILYAKLLKDPTQAKNVYIEALSLRDTLAKDFPQDQEQIRKQASTHMNYGNVLNMLKQGDEALVELEAAQHIRENLLKEYADNLKVQQDLALGAFQLARLYFSRFENSQDKADDAAFERESRKAISIYEMLTKQDSRRLINRTRLVECYLLLATRADKPNDFSEEAATLYDKAKEVSGKLYRENPDVLDYRNQYAQVLLQQIYVLKKKGGSLEKAKNQLIEIDSLLSSLAKQNSDACQILAIAQSEWGYILLDEQEVPNAHAHFNLSLNYWYLWEKQTGGNPDSQASIQEITQLLQPPAVESPKTTESSPDSP